MTFCLWDLQKKPLQRNITTRKDTLHFFLSCFWLRKNRTGFFGPVLSSRVGTTTSFLLSYFFCNISQRRNVVRVGMETWRYGCFNRQLCLTGQQWPVLYEGFFKELSQTVSKAKLGFFLSSLQLWKPNIVLTRWILITYESHVLRMLKWAAPRQTTLLLCFVYLFILSALIFQLCRLRYVVF